MNARAPIPADPPETDVTDVTDVTDAWARAVLQRQSDMLERLAGIGLQMAEAVGREATSGGDGGDRNALAMAYARVSRAVRMSLLLQAKLIRDFRTPPKAPSAEAKDGQVKDGKVKDVNDYEIYWADGTPVSLAAEKRVLRKTVRELAEDRGLDRETAERLEAEALDLMGREDLFPTARGPGHRTFPDMVALICEDLGLGLGPGAESSPLPTAQKPEDLEPPRTSCSSRGSEPTWLSG